MSLSTAAYGKNPVCGVNPFSQPNSDIFAANIISRGSPIPQLCLCGSRKISACVIRYACSDIYFLSAAI